MTSIQILASRATELRKLVSVSQFSQDVRLQGKSRGIRISSRKKTKTICRADLYLTLTFQFDFLVPALDRSTS